ncbi:hypothetical protein KAFR_0B06625 [Kazachstania africana CBS 2517]|uniref:Uncharacterized protein n=1 Tax=Kazachstania africana (strain ATCC 22294 / BCRC 22015 / CBS 2517 / CECT 1963 / NBRC 1671 / NRRL Y-8276) TaxID=1071382 RepID=H2ARF9_KAZAF|nr:LOW QUALITY PROTEIN: hypothetical protein KAFR_0B06625 [Kazachstania africana CBS 2517]CCF56959.1 hypothetical protein KAFR_0B06625 [Kazachstania africana CBS 2517]
MPTTPVESIRHSVANNSGDIRQPSNPPYTTGDPFVRTTLHGSPMYVNPTMFANQFQQYDMNFQPYPQGFVYPPHHINVQHGVASSSSDHTLHDIISNNGIDRPSHANSNHGTMLYKLADASEFQDWIKVFSAFIKEHGMEHVLPDAQGDPTTEPTESEERFLTQVFQYFVPTTTYPQWFKTELRNNLTSTYDVIEIALSKYDVYMRDYEIAKKLNNIHYDGKENPKLFKKRVAKLRKIGEKIGITTTDRAICDQLITTLPTAYKPIVDDYRIHYRSTTLNDILNSIQQFKISRPDTSSYSPKNTRQQISTSAPTKNVPSKTQTTGNTTKANNPTNSNTKAPRRRNVNYITHDEPIEQLEVLGNEDQIHPEELLIIDSGAEISVVQSSSMLNNTFNPTRDILYDAGSKELTVESGGYLCLSFDTASYRIKALASPEISCNILSLHALERASISVDLINRVLIDKKGNILTKLIDYGRYVCIPLSVICTTQVVNNVRTKFAMNFFHKLFGHINIRDIKKLSIRI